MLFSERERARALGNESDYVLCSRTFSASGLQECTDVGAIKDSGVGRRKRKRTMHWCSGREEKLVVLGLGEDHHDLVGVKPASLTCFISSRLQLGG